MWRDNEGMNAYIPGYNESTPEVKSEKLIDYVNSELRQKNLIPLRIFAIADSK